MQIISDKSVDVHNDSRNIINLQTIEQTPAWNDRFYIMGKKFPRYIEKRPINGPKLRALFLVS